MPRVRQDALTRQIAAYLRKRRSPLAQYAPAFVQIGRRYGIDPRFLVAIAGAETSFATDPNAGRDITTGHNPFGMGPHIQYPTWEAGIAAAASNLRRNYLDRGLTDVVSIRNKWAPASAANDPQGLNSQWVNNVRAVLGQLGAPEVVGPRRVPFRLRTWRHSRFPWLPRRRPRRS